MASLLLPGDAASFFDDAFQYCPDHGLSRDVIARRLQDILHYFRYFSNRKNKEKWGSITHNTSFLYNFSIFGGINSILYKTLKSIFIFFPNKVNSPCIFLPSCVSHNVSWAIGFLLGAINIFTEVNVNHYILQLIFLLISPGEQCSIPFP